MDTTTTNYIEAKNIGRVASRAGFTVQTHGATRIRGWHHYTEGFAFSQNENGWIRVSYRPATGNYDGFFYETKIEQIAIIRNYFESKGYEIEDNRGYPAHLRVRKAK